MLTVDARARCLTCRRSWTDASAIETAIDHATTEGHRVVGLRQQRLDHDGRGTTTKENR